MIKNAIAANSDIFKAMYMYEMLEKGEMSQELFC
jgi:hypothetical protein